MASVIKAGNATDGVQVTSDNTGILELKTGTGSGTTAVTIGTDQSVTFAGAISSSGNQTVTGNLTVNGNTTLGDANTDTILMTAAPSIGGAGLGMGFGFRNRIINGAMVIDQRNAGAAVNTNGTYPVDRFLQLMSGGGVLTSQRSTTAPTGFINSIFTQVTTADASIAAGDYYLLRHVIEGFNVADLGWGAAGAQSVTLSFQVRSSVTGTFSGSLTNSAEDRSYPFTYSISSANTWTSISVTIPGDTSGTWLKDNGVGIRVNFDLGTGSTRLGTANAWGSSVYFGATGSVQLISTLNATFYITGVQLEKGSTATSFDYRPYTTELQLCQRYYFKYVASSGSSGFFAGYASQTTVADGIVSFPVSMRTPPTSLETTGTASNYRVRFLNTAATCSSVPTFFIADIDSSHIRFPVSSGLTAGDGIIGASNAAANVAYLAWSAEL